MPRSYLFSLEDIKLWTSSLGLVRRVDVGVLRRGDRLVNIEYSVANIPHSVGVWTLKTSAFYLVRGPRN